MAYMNCECCNNPIYPFGPSKLAEVANEYNIRPLASLPIKPEITRLVDQGKIESIEYPYLDNLIKFL